MSTVVDPVRDTTNNGLDPLIHCYCPECEPEGLIGLCGTELAGIQAFEAEVTCIVCDQMFTCPECGQEFEG